MVQLNKQLDQLNNQRIIDADSIRILVEDNKQLRQAITEKDEQINELKNLVMTQSQQIASLNDQLVTLKNDISHLKNDVDNLNDKNTALLGQIRKAESAADNPN